MLDCNNNIKHNRQFILSNLKPYIILISIEENQKNGQQHPYFNLAIPLGMCQLMFGRKEQP